MSQGLPEPQTRTITIPTQVSNAWDVKEIVKVVTYILTLLMAAVANYQVSEIRNVPLPVTPVAPTTSTPNVPVAPVSPVVPIAASPTVTQETVDKAVRESEKRILEALDKKFSELR